MPTLLQLQNIMSSDTTKQRIAAALLLIASEHANAVLPENPNAGQIDVWNYRKVLASRIVEAPDHWVRVMSPGLMQSLANSPHIINLPSTDLSQQDEEGLDEAIKTAVRGVYDFYLGMVVPR